jgi:hydrogenase-1 operon protein HyaF
LQIAENPMKSFPIPVRMLGPGSQPAEEDALQVLHMDRDVGSFTMPQVPASADDAHLAAARDLLAAFCDRLRDWREGEGPELELTHVAAGPLGMANQMLGEGEVSVRIRGPREIHIQETIFAGVWRVQEHDEPGRVVRDRLMACPIPSLVTHAARATAAPRPRTVEVPAGAMNSPALLREIDQQVTVRRNGAPAHVVNLTLLPLTPTDHQVLEQAIAPGPVAIMSRGFGSCRVSSTLVRDVWRVQYFNSMQTMILNTLEVVEVPEAALAAPEDLADSRERLGELVDWMTEACGQ